MKRAYALLTVSLAVAAGLAAGCAKQAADGAAATGSQPRPSPANVVPDGYAGRFQVRTSVLEDATHGPQLCTGMALSLPPQCGGPDVVGWKWDSIPHESAARTKWGDYLLVGTFDGKKFTLTEPARVPGAQASAPGAPGGPDFTTPCAAPAGGWKPVDKDKATDAAFNDAVAKANGDPDFGGLWIDEPAAALDPTPHNDPQRMVLNVRYTKDLSRHEAELRKVWGGALCVSQAQHTEAELRRIQDELTKEPGVFSAGVDSTTGTVTLGVYVAEASRQRELDARYGPNVVVLEGTLQPLD